MHTRQEAPTLSYLQCKTAGLHNRRLLLNNRSLSQVRLRHHLCRPASPSAPHHLMLDKSLHLQRQPPEEFLPTPIHGTSAMEQPVQEVRSATHSSQVALTPSY